MKKRIFLDTNIIIDYLSGRKPFGENAYKIFLMHNDAELCISALSFTTIYYVLRKGHDHRHLLDLLKDLMDIVYVLPVNSDIIENAVRSEFTDFEDAVQYFTALSASSDYIITRNVKDYSLSEIEVFSPDEFLNLD